MPGLTKRLHKVLDGSTAGDPMASINWPRKSTRVVALALRVSHTKAWKMLRAEKYRLRFNRERLARKSSPDRNQQFQEINRLKESFARRGQPVISVDAKKRELVGLFKNQGRAWRQTPIDVGIYDFPSDADGVAIPYGVYDVTRGDGFVAHGMPPATGDRRGGDHGTVSRLAHRTHDLDRGRHRADRRRPDRR